MLFIVGQFNFPCIHCCAVWILLSCMLCWSVRDLRYIYRLHRKVKLYFSKLKQKQYLTDNVTHTYTATIIDQLLWWRCIHTALKKWRSWYIFRICCLYLRRFFTRNIENIFPKGSVYIYRKHGHCTLCYNVIRISGYINQVYSSIKHPLILKCLGISLFQT